MKVTALIPDVLIEEARTLAHGGTTTETLIIVLKDWIETKKLQTLNQAVRSVPLKFSKNFSAVRIRKLNRKL